MQTDNHPRLKIRAVVTLVHRLLTSDHHRREGVLTGHRRCLAEAGGVQGVLRHQLLFLSVSSAWRG